MMAMAVSPVDVKKLEKGIDTITVEDFRWYACHIKSISLIANIMLREQASQADVVDAILIRDGKVTEGTASNLFMVKDDVLVTPPTSKYLLPGITRDLVLELASENNFEYKELAIKEYELRGADEVWLTSSMKDILPVTSLDGKKISDGAPGPFWKKMNDLLQSFKANV